MKLRTIVFLLSLSGLVSCNSIDKGSPKELPLAINPLDTIDYEITGDYYQDFLNKVIAYQATFFIPIDSLIAIENSGGKLEPSFDFVNYFKIFDKLKVKPGWEIDYQYAFSGDAGRPAILGLRNGQSLEKLVDSLKSSLGILRYAFDSVSYTDYLLVELSVEGCFQYALFNLIGDQFGLFGGANYGRRKIICSDATLSDEVDFLIKERGLKKTIKTDSLSETDRLNRAWSYRRSQLDSIQLLGGRPEIKLLGDSICQISMMHHSDWGGLMKVDYEIELHFPHEFTLQRDSLLAYYDSMLLF